MIPIGASVVLPLLAAIIVSIVARLKPLPMRIAAAAVLVIALVGFRIVPSPAVLTLIAAPAGWLLLTTVIAHRVLAPRVPIDHTWRHAVIGGALLGGLATSTAILATSQDRRHGARLATLAWVAGVCSPLGGIGTVAVWRTPSWLLVSIPLLAVCTALLRSTSRTAAIPPEYRPDAIVRVVLAMGVAMLVLGSGGAWHLAERFAMQTPLMVYSEVILASVFVDPAALTLSLDAVLGLTEFERGAAELAPWLALACTPVPVLILLFARFGGNAVRDAKHAFLPLLLGALFGIALTTSA